MTAEPERWRPSARERIAFLREEAVASRGRALEVRPPEHSFMTFGISTDGWLYMRIECDPASVRGDLTSAYVQIAAVPEGCQVAIAPSVSDWTAGSFFEEIQALVESGEPRGSAAETCLRRWRDLLSPRAGTRLGDRELAGLFGELEVLEAVVAAGGGLEHWTGWRRDAVDFRLPRLAIEVKATLSADYRRVRIHGLGQLADPEDGSRLVLVLRRIERSPNGRSVPDLVETLVKAGLSRSSLLNALLECGYSEAHRTEYERVTFLSDVVALREINDAHPRLTPDVARAIDLQAIDRVDYVLNLNGTEADDLDDTIEDLVRRQLGGTR